MELKMVGWFRALLTIGETQVQATVDEGYDDWETHPARYMPLRDTPS